MSTPIEKFLEAKEELLKDTLNDPNLDEYQKLCLIEEHRLYPILSYIHRPFECFVTEYRNELKRVNPDVRIYGVDDFINDGGWRQRGDTVYISSVIECIEEDDEDEVPVLKAGKGLPDFKMKRADVIKHLYKWCIDNKAVGYTFDW